MKALSIVCICILLISTTSYANIINIPDDYVNIQAGIDAAFDSDTILVANGVYHEAIDFGGRDVYLTSMYLFSGNRDDIDFTIINADSQGSAITFNSGESVAAGINGFTITGGRSVYGGGLLCKDSDPTVTNCIIIDNHSIGFGGAIYCENSSPIMSDNHLTNNFALDNGAGIYCLNSAPIINNNVFAGNITDENAGAIYCWYSNPTITNNNFVSNYAGDRGGAIYLWGSNPRILYNRFRLNEAQRYGGAMYIYSSDPVIYGNNISYNSSDERGGGIFFWHSTPIIKSNLISYNYSVIAGGIYCADNSDAEIINNTVVSNTGNDIAGGFYCRDSQPELINNIFWNNQSPDGAEFYLTSSAYPIISYCNIEGGWDGIGNIDSAPLFRDTLSGNYHLMAIDCGDPYDSPCIDAGDPELPDDSLSCDYGLGTIRSDIGCYGGGMIMVGIDDDETICQVLPSKTNILYSYPNPFNGTTAVRFVNKQAGDIDLSVYNILGRKVVTLYNGHADAGDFQISWNAGELASGAYFARLTTSAGSRTHALFLLK